MGKSNLSGNPSHHCSPVIMVDGNTLPEVWETALFRLVEKGRMMPTEYDPTERSRDAVMIMVVHSPLAEPRIHCGASVGSLSFYDEYVAEVLNGVNDDEVFKGRLSYTYHQRIFDYTTEDGFEHPELKGTGFDQIRYVIDKLVKAPYSRRAQAITWNPLIDPNREDPPCLQRLWFRIYQKKDEHFLAMHTHWRSRDALHAAFLNMYALTLLQKRVAELVSKQLEIKIQVGQYVDISDSFHVYERVQDSLNRFLKTSRTLQPEQKHWTTSHLRDLIQQTTNLKNQKSP
ncbi:MAG: thymidylate synthase [Promethearchaeota archaeon]